MNDVEAGKRRLRESIAIDERRGSIAGVSDTYAEMGAYLERAGDAAGAIEALHQHRLLADQLLQRDQQRAILEMQEQFDAERRARELELLERDSRLKGEELRTQELQRRLVWLLAACGAVMFGVVAVLLRRVRRTNEQLAHSNARLEQQAGIDPLTGLANRRRFLAEMQREGADRAFTGTVLLADLDHFKRINDEHGHAAGDAVLVQAADRLRAALREADLIVRWGGEEFLVVVRALGHDAVHALAQRMLDAIGGRPFEHDGRQLHTTVSIGWATFPIEPALLALPWERAIGLVDTALYLAKAHGRNRAYGVRRANARDAAQLEATGRALEDAWMAGEVALTQIEGPRRGSPGAARLEPVTEAA
jgi:diguanylate cyclase (GGDEF)-like protein